MTDYVKLATKKLEEMAERRHVARVVLPKLAKRMEEIGLYIVARHIRNAHKEACKVTGMKMPKRRVKP